MEIQMVLEHQFIRNLTLRIGLFAELLCQASKLLVGEASRPGWAGQWGLGECYVDGLSDSFV